MKKVLFIRLSSIGDIVLTSPVVRCTRQKYGDAEIHFLTRQRFRSIVENNPVIDKVFSFEHSPSEVLPLLQHEKYDLVVDLHRNMRTWMIKLALRAPSKTFPKLNWRKWWYVRMKIGTLPALHIVDRYFKAVESIGVRNDGQGLDFFIGVKDRIDTEKAFNRAPESYVTLVLGAAHYTKRIPVDKLRDICRLSPFPLVLIGGKEEIEPGIQLAREFPGKVYNACGKCNLQQSASVIRQSAHVITPDTGMMHIAAAFQKPMTVIWGNTVPEFGMFPYVPGNLWQNLEVHGLKCRPCSKIGYQRCPAGHFKCMQDQKMEDIRFPEIELSQEDIKETA